MCPGLSLSAGPSGERKGAGPLPAGSYPDRAARTASACVAVLTLSAVPIS